MFEFDAFAHGTETIARAIARSAAFSIAGGGDTLAAIAKYGIEQDVGYISTGGGAFLEVLEGKTLPALEILARARGRLMQRRREPPFGSRRRHCAVASARGAHKCRNVPASDCACENAAHPFRGGSLPMARRATKIVATLGPASSEPELLEQMIRAGVNVVRLNFSHGKAQDHIDRAQLVREAAQRAGREVAIMADLQGPKIRVGKFADGKVHAGAGQPFVLDAAAQRAGRRRAASAWTTRSCRATCAPATRCCSTTA